MKSLRASILVLSWLASLVHADDKANKSGKIVTNSIGMELRLIKAGRFVMGRLGGDKTERPRRVRIGHNYYLGVTEVTQEQWKVVMGTRPWKGKDYIKEGPKYPTTYVDWDDAMKFCKRLSQREKVKYRLPTEAEWEFACRAGTTTKYYFGDDESKLGDYAWFGGLSGNGNTKNERYPHRVGTKRPNPWGLYDMHGNVSEWCQYSSGPVTLDFRPIRGGNWFYRATSCQSGYSALAPNGRDAGFGFRVAVDHVLVKKPAGTNKSGDR